MLTLVAKLQTMAPIAHQALTTETICDEPSFLRLADEWRKLEHNAGIGSIFLTFDYIRAAWTCFSGPDDRLRIIIVRCGPGLVGVLPLRLGTTRTWGIELRTVKFIPEWEGDQHGLLATQPEDFIWPLVLSELLGRRQEWDVLQLSELPENSWPIKNWRCLGPMLAKHCQSDTRVDYVNIRGTWSDFLARIQQKTRSNYRRSLRKLSTDFPDWCIESINTPTEIGTAFERYLSIEQSGWKRSAGIGVAKDQRHLEFYRKLLPELAACGRAVVHILNNGSEDMAARIDYAWQQRVYKRHIAHNPKFAAYAPGIVLKVETLKTLFGSQYLEADFMGMSPSVERHHITDWCDGQRTTYRLTIHNLLTKTAPLSVAVGTVRFLKKLKYAVAFKYLRRARVE